MIFIVLKYFWNLSVFYMNKKFYSYVIEDFFCEGIINNKNIKFNLENIVVKVGYKIIFNLSYG